MELLLIATHNAGKKIEYAELFQGLPWQLTTLKEQGVKLVVEENGATFAENAIVKARGYAQSTGLVTLADDSGLEVDALGGEPGVYTARYGGEGLSDRDRYLLVLDKLQDVPMEKRAARFRCAIAICWPSGRTEVVEGACEGAIALSPRGEHGFGYDPIFFVAEYGCTMAELKSEVKNRISHRARAAEKARVFLGAKQ